MEERQKKTTQYRCAECGGVVTVTAHGPVEVRPCGHDEVGVLANVSAVAYGAGHTRQKDAVQ